ncbi:hypothetical protein GUITHDRAFT_110613 [Guillardia theta CCMP2712]|uniref:Uncharacterized protein n=1 Tax=Guillardia theta (strain CCMP2712) TaxID=905079 RepID=L1J4M8_GUITC|nr:hypothetical protein GUITHDRAFT_110613 [Guillardia theta CCMP2712]EKX43488.1 hypothetical protein GUITHDRAFT_110613 [Guillardia theta CCMP2712]|eukprot:XP_005830468.1 hypothetical protein GUITHDRAFT_110613 [Guillardia theta CCMP2712]
MAMDSNSFSVLRDNQKQYRQTAIVENPYASESEKMKSLERKARMEECLQSKTKDVCDAEERFRKINEGEDNGVRKGSDPLTVALPVVITTGLSGFLLKFLNR